MSSKNYESILDICTASLMTQIRNYTEDQLQNLLNDDSRLYAMVDSMPQVSSLPADKEMRLAQSKSLAEYNLSMEPRLKEAINRLHHTHNETVKTKQEVELLKAQLDSISESRSLDTVSTLLQASVQEAEDESEKIFEKFQEGDTELDDFIKIFMGKRIQMHTRKVKSEKLKEILRQQLYK